MITHCNHDITKICHTLTFHQIKDRKEKFKCLYCNQIIKQ